MNRKDRRAGEVQKQKQTELMMAVKNAHALIAQGRSMEADKYFQAALRIAPGHPKVLLDFGINAYQRADYALARRVLEQLVTSHPTDTAGLTALAMVELNDNGQARATALVEKIESLRPDPVILTKLATIYRDLGNIDKACTILADVIARAPDYAAAHFYYSGMKKYTAEDADYKSLLSLAGKSGSLPPPQRMLLHFALGKAHTDTGNAEEAFKHYAAGNQIKKQSSPPHDAELHEKYIDHIIDIFNEDVVARLQGRVTAAPDAPVPVFIVGMPRSGSTLTDQIVASHPDAVSIGESKNLPKVLPHIPNKEFGHMPGMPGMSMEMLAHMTPETLAETVLQYFKLSAAQTEGKKYLIDKMLFNYLWVGYILLAFPNAKILHTRRDPVDTGLSIYTLLFSEPLSWTYNQKDIARYHLACDKLMAHWKKLFPGRIMDVVYEDLVEDQEGKSRDILAFCDIPWDDQCLRFFENKRTVRTLSAEQVRKPVYKDSVKRWKKYEPYLADMIDTLEKGGYKLR